MEQSKGLVLHPNWAQSLWKRAGCSRLSHTSEEMDWCLAGLQRSTTRKICDRVNLTKAQVALSWY